MVEAAGIDTWSVAWRMTQKDGNLLSSVCDRKAGRARIREEKLEGHTIGFFPHSGLAFVEGHPTEGRLAKADELGPAWESIKQALEGMEGGIVPRREWIEVASSADLTGARAFGVPMLRRLDVTVDLRFDSAAEGLAVLAGVAALPVARCKTETIREAGGRAVETVYLRGMSGKQVLGRWYDKGNETGRIGRGRWVRPEDQRRFTSSSGRPVLEAAYDGRFVRELFVRRFEPLWKASRGITVGSVRRVGEKILDHYEAGEITAGQAKAVAGHLVLDMAGAHRQSDRQYYRDRALARKLGLVLADGVDEEVEIDLHEVMEEALDSSVWGSQG